MKEEIRVQELEKERARDKASERARDKASERERERERENSKENTSPISLKEPTTTRPSIHIAIKPHGTKVVPLSKLVDSMMNSFFFLC